MIDHQLELGRLGDRKVCRLRALENAAGIRAGLTPRIENRARVADQSAGFDVLAMTIQRRESLARCKRDQWRAELLAENCIRGDEQRINWGANQGCERRLGVPLVGGIYDTEPQPERIRRSPQVSELGLYIRRRCVRVHEHADGDRSGERLV
jgi:hypothetical protein